MYECNIMFADALNAMFFLIFAAKFFLVLFDENILKWEFWSCSV